MPGIPSSRGCDECRKQKKKCDQLKPQCSRCIRLQIFCVGAGRQRYKFIADQRSRNSSAPASVSNSLQTRDRTPFGQFRHDAASQRLVRSPINEMTTLTNELTWRLKATDDLKFNLSWTFGCFLEDIPGRLGTNRALDAAVAALLAAHSNFCLRYHQIVPKSTSVEVLAKYSRAIENLRVCLNDAVTARKAETLCSVMLLLICQSLFESDEETNWSRHGEGAAQILKARGYYDAGDVFERKLLLTLRGSVLFEALINPKIHFSPREWRILVENDLDGNSHEGQTMRCLSSLPNIMQRGRIGLQSRTDLQTLVEETRDLNNKAKATDLHQTLKAVQPGNSSLQFTTLSRYVHSYNLRLYGLGITICLVYNSVLRAIDTNDIVLDLDSTYFCEEVLSLSVEAAAYRPLCASYVTLCLIAAWCSCQDDALQIKLQVALIDCQPDFGGKGISLHELEHMRGN